MSLVRSTALLTCALLLSSTAVYAQEANACESLVGVWENATGRKFVVEQYDAERGYLEGYYQLPPIIDPIKYAAVGWTNTMQGKAADDIAITFAVRWNDLTSLTSWVGVCGQRGDSAQLELIWHQVRLNTRPRLERISTGSDTFRRRVDEDDDEDEDDAQ